MMTSRVPTVRKYLDERGIIFAFRRCINIDNFGCEKTHNLIGMKKIKIKYFREQGMNDIIAYLIQKILIKLS